MLITKVTHIAAARFTVLIAALTRKPTDVNFSITNGLKLLKPSSQA